MSKTSCDVKISFTVEDPEHLPDDMYYPEVVEELRDFLSTALGEWYAGRGKDLVCFEPMVI